MKTPALLLSLGLLGAFVPARGAGAAASNSLSVLDLERGSFRSFMGWRTPTLVGPDSQPLPLREPRRPDLKEEERLPVPLRESASPAAHWSAPEFDDSEWVRIRGPASVQHNGLDWNRVYLRGSFVVTDPAQVRALRLRVRYHGGVRLLVNGTELARAHLPAGEMRSDTLAERYPEEAYLRPDGRLYGAKDGQDKALVERLLARERALPAADTDGLPVPANLLRKGLNVLAVECHAAPVSLLAYDAPSADASPDRAVWPHAGVIAARLDCAATDALVPNTGPAPGISIGNVSPCATLSVWDYVPLGATQRPVRLVGAANGIFSGRVILSSAETISGLKAMASDLVQVGGQRRIPASAVWIRWAEVATPDKVWGRANGFDRLLADPPAAVKPSAAGPGGALPAAVVPVWITVRVPAAAAPGDYAGSVAIAARGSEAFSFTVPLQIRIHAWKVPDPPDFTIVNNMLQSPDSVAQYYQVPLWSDKHFALLGKSLDVLHQVGSRVCNLNLIAGMHGYGNRESMVKWVKQDDGTFAYDFTVAEKYMDVYARTCGKPRFLQVNVWAFPGDNPAKPKWPPESVTVVDRDGKWLENRLQPPYGTPENEAFWRPVLTELRRRLEQRGWFDVTRIGWLAYQSGPDKGIVDVARNIWPDGKWMKNSHQASKNFFGMPVVCNSAVWGVGALYDPDCETRWRQRPVYAAAGRLAYPRPWTTGAEDILVGIPRWGASFVRPGLYGQSSLMRYRTMAEATLQGNIRGMGQIGGDFWPLPIGTKGRLDTICTGQGAVTPRVNTLAMCSPGPDGAIFNERLEMFREGIQIYEALVYLQQALAAKRVGDELASRIGVLLDERARSQLHNHNPLPVGPGNDPGHWMTRELTDWRRSDGELLALAGEVAAQNSVKPGAP